MDSVYPMTIQAAQASKARREQAQRVQTAAAYLQQFTQSTPRFRICKKCGV
jgi:hypothetical protein